MPDHKIFLDKYEQKCRYCYFYEDNYCIASDYSYKENDDCQIDNFILSDEFAVHECELDEE